MKKYEIDRHRHIYLDLISVNIHQWSLRIQRIITENYKKSNMLTSVFTSQRKENIYIYVLRISIEL